jgi:thiol:disulfide interchange protein
MQLKHTMLIAIAALALGCAPQRDTVVVEPTPTQPAAPAAEMATAGELQWAANFEAAAEQARADNKLVMLKFTADW